MNVVTYVFSYNRGKSLENLIESAKKINWRWDIIIYDDCSTDKYTINLLTHLEKNGYKVMYSNKKKDHRLGGLYVNMTTVLRESKADIVMFMQDDMQFVREISNTEMNRICELLHTNKSPFMLPSFFTNIWSITQRAKYNEIDDVYRIEPPEPYGGASDVCIFNRKKLISDGWNEFVTEQESDSKACRMYGSMTVYPDPFVAFIPFPPIPRMNILKRIIASRGVKGIVKYQEMNEIQNTKFLKRNKKNIPIDTEILSPNGGLLFKIINKLIGVRY